MQIAKYKVPCECGEFKEVEVNLFTGEHRIISPIKPTGFAELKAVTDHYKKLKGFDQIQTWDKLYRPRAFAAAKKLLNFFSKHEAPIDLIRELLADINTESVRIGYSWTLETAVKRAPDWLAGKIKGPARRRDD